MAQKKTDPREEDRREDTECAGEVARAKVSVHILRGLISYHERMTMGNCPERDFYLDGLRFALICVEEKIPEKDAV